MTDPRGSSGTNQLFSLTGRTAVVTGASSGLGVGFVRTLREAGAKVVVAARREVALHQLYGHDDGVLSVPTDVALQHDRYELVQQAISWSGRVDILVNNAGTGGSPSADEEDSDAFAHVLNVNLTAPFDLARMVAAQSEPTVIVNIASIASMVSTAPVGGASYVASKAGLAGLTRELAAQWGRRGVRVNALAPGWFVTELNSELFQSAGATRWVEKRTTLGRLGNDGELAGALLYLCSDASSYMTGQVLVVDGGWTAR